MISNVESRSKYLLKHLNKKMGKAGWLLLDIGLAIIPFIPNLGGARHLNKVDDVIDIASTINKVA